VFCCFCFGAQIAYACVCGGARMHALLCRYVHVRMYVCIEG